MPISGSSPNKSFSRTDGTRSGTDVWQQSAAANRGIQATDQDYHDNDIATAINTCLFKDGGNAATGNLPMGGFKLTNLGTGSSSSDSARIDQLIPATTSAIFVQTAAPTGWTKSTTHNDKALRVVSGTASSGGSVAFSTAFASQTPAGTVGSHALTQAELPNCSFTVTDPGHSHGIAYTALANSGGAGRILNGASTDTTNSNTTGITVSSGGSGTAHTHTFSGTAINLAVNYVDCIIATRDAYA